MQRRIANYRSRKLFLLLLFLPLCSLGQKTYDWPFLDPIQDSTLGISVNKAYDFLKNKTSHEVIVAVIDNGVDLKHEDLQGVFWTNPKEIPNNGIDDDKNGYIDDMHGWNFLGNANGNNLKQETTELTRYYAILRNKYKEKTEKELYDSVSKQEYRVFLEVQKEYTAEVLKKQAEIDFYKKLKSYYDLSIKTLQSFFNRTNFEVSEVRQITDTTKTIVDARHFLLYCYDNKITLEEIEKQIVNNEKELATRLYLELNNRKLIVNDNPDDITDSIYGNNRVDAEGPYHGTGVAGVIGALNNNCGVDGIAKNVKLMIIRIVPNGDERDKDIALAIRYAIRNGASIINCSFAKKYTIHPDFLTKATEEAEKAGVLIVHAAGNWASNNDETPYYPTGKCSNGKIANNWITVGASAAKDNANLVGSFSNYGAQSVDVFAPGVNIKTCALNNKYDIGSGTSIAAPIVSGMAAVLKSYYPQLTAAQLKEIIIKSAYIPKTKEVTISSNAIKLNFKDISISGGIVNLYYATQLIENKYYNSKQKK